MGFFGVIRRVNTQVSPNGKIRNFLSVGFRVQAVFDNVSKPYGRGVIGYYFIYIYYFKKIISFMFFVNKLYFQVLKCMITSDIGISTVCTLLEP